MASFAIQKLISLCPICLFPLLFLLPCKTLENVATIYIGESFACVLFYEFYYVMSCLSVLATLSLFLCMMWGYLLASLIYMWLSNFPSTTYWRNCLFSIVYFASFVKNWLWVCGFISGLSMLFHWNMSIFMPIPYCFDYCSFVVLSEVWKGVPLALFFFLRIALAILGPL